MLSAYPWIPIFRICWIHASLFDRKMNAKIFDMKLLNILQSFGSENCLQSAHDSYWLSLQHVRILHQVAFSLSWQPKHLSLRYDLHAPQYNPQYATNCGSETISFISIPPPCLRGCEVSRTLALGKMMNFYFWLSSLILGQCSRFINDVISYYMVHHFFQPRVRSEG